MLTFNTSGFITTHFISDPPRRPDDGWTNLNPDAPRDREPGPPERREEELLPLDLDDGDLLDLEPLEPITEANYLDPVRQWDTL